MKHRVIEQPTLSSKKKGKYLTHVWTKRMKRTLTISQAAQTHWTGHKISARRLEVQFQKSRFYEPGCLSVRFEVPEKKEKITLRGTDSTGKEYTYVMEKVTRPKFWQSTILRYEEVKALIDFLTTETEQWLGPPAPTQHNEKVWTYEEISEMGKE